MIPATLEAWNLEAILHLLAQGYYETEVFDFKEMLPHKTDEDDKLRLIKTCCAFANSSGGFLVFGVKDAKAIKVGESIESRFIGFDPIYDLPELFGSYPQRCSPSVVWDFKNPPIQLENGHVIHVVQIPRSWNAPHCFETQGKGSDHLRCFTKRTNKGNEDMSYEEIRMAFLQYYEKRLKLQLLRAELENFKSNASRLDAIDFGFGEFRLTVIETVLADTYTIFAGNQELLATLTQIRNLCIIVNGRLQVHFALYASENLNKEGIMRGMKKEKHSECSCIVTLCDQALELLANVINA